MSKNLMLLGDNLVCKINRVMYLKLVILNNCSFENDVKNY